MVEQTEKALKSWGVNTNLGPSLGVYREEGDILDQYGRSFSSDPAIATQCARDYLSWMFVSTPVFVVAKYFPGLGAADESTDDGPVTIDLDLDTLMNIDMAPYNFFLNDQSAYKLQIIMPSWATYLALDPDRHAGLRSKVIRGELRE